MRASNVWAGAAILLGAGLLVATSFSEARVEYGTVEAARAARRDVRLTGKVAPASVTRDVAALVLRFTLVDEAGATIPVEYEGVVPDAFREGGEAVVEGRYDEGAGVFRARVLLAKCPSKYEGKGPAPHP